MFFYGKEEMIEERVQSERECLCNFHGMEVSVATVEKNKEVLKEIKDRSTIKKQLLFVYIPKKEMKSQSHKNTVTISVFLVHCNNSHNREMHDVLKLMPQTHICTHTYYIHEESFVSHVQCESPEIGSATGGLNLIAQF